MPDLPERDDLGLAYNETMSLACQFGRCDDCPEAGEFINECSCICHIPDDTADQYADALAEAWYENYYGTART
jgi:hypothetical protein